MGGKIRGVAEDRKMRKGGENSLEDKKDIFFSFQRYKFHTSR